MYGPMNIILPKPNVGDLYVRTTLGGQFEVSQILCVTEWKGLWKARLACEQNWAYVQSYSGHIGEHDWRPAGWVKNPGDGTYHAPNQRWAAGEDGVTGEWLEIEDAVTDAAIVTRAVPGDDQETPAPAAVQRTKVGRKPAVSVAV